MAHSYPSTFDGERWHHTFSQSVLKTFLKCPEQLRLELAGETEDTSFDSGVIGNGMHAGIESMLLDDNYESAHDAVERKIDSLAPWQQKKHKEADVYALGHSCFDIWLDNVYERVDAEHVEWNFDEVLTDDDERTINLKGYIDCIDKNGLIWDWKQTARPYDKWEYQRWAIQPTVYTWGYDSTLDPAMFRYCVILHNGDVQEFDVWRDQGHWDFMRKQVLGLALLIEANLGQWPMTDDGWWCSEKWCPAWEQCKGASVPVDWKDYK